MEDADRLDVEWDTDKDESNNIKHGVGFDEAATVFLDPLEAAFPDPEHSTEEQRFLSIGVATSGRIIVVSYTERDDRVRIISAREPTRGERKFYEET